MTLQHISIPFDTHQRRGTCNIPVLSKKEFLTLARRIDEISDLLFDRERSFMLRSFCLTLPRRCTINHFIMSSEQGLKFVCEDNRLWLGFIPFYDPAGGSEQSENRGRKFFTHYRLDDFLKPIDRRICKQNNVSLFSLPLLSKINKEAEHSCVSINHISFLLLFDSAEKEGALVFCNGPLPFVSLSPIIFPRQQINPNIQDIPSQQTSSVVIPFLQAKRSGFLHFPIWSLDHWNQEIKRQRIKDNTFQNTFSPYKEQFFMHDAFILFPMGVSFNQDQQIEGINCAFIQNGPCVQMAFFFKEKSDKAHHDQNKAYNSYFIQTFSSKSKKYYLSACTLSVIILGNNTSFVKNLNSNNLELKGCSLFFLASEDGKMCRLCYKGGHFELKCTRPTDPEGGVFPIGRLLEQFSAKEPPEKKSRRDEGETSHVAIEESRRVVEARREEEAKRECAETLIFFSQQE